MTNPIAALALLGMVVSFVLSCSYLRQIERSQRYHGYRRRTCDERALRFFRELEQRRRRAARSERGPVALLPLRDELRRMIRARPLVGLCDAAQQVNDPVVLRMIFIAMRRVRIPASLAVASIHRSYDARVRGEIARLLRSVRAWDQLEAYLKAERNPRVLAMGQETTPLPHAARLERFMCHGQTPRAAQRTGERMRFWAQEPLGPGKRPKSDNWIRFLLLRIRALVRGA